MQEEIIGTIPQVEGELILEVALIHDEAGRTRVELRHLIWGKELGWYRQQTLTLDGTTASQLLCRLSSVRQRLRGKPHSCPRDNVIAFPRRPSEPLDVGHQTTRPRRERIATQSVSGHE